MSDYGNESEWGEEDVLSKNTIERLGDQYADLQDRRKHINAKLQKYFRLGSPKGTLAYKYRDSPKKMKKRPTEGYVSPKKQLNEEDFTEISSPVRGKIRPKSASAIGSTRKCMNTTPTRTPTRTPTKPKPSDSIYLTPTSLKKLNQSSSSPSLSRKSNDPNPNRIRPASANAVNKTNRSTNPLNQSAIFIREKIKKSEQQKLELEIEVKDEVRKMEQKIFACIDEANTLSSTLGLNVKYYPYDRTLDVSAGRYTNRNNNKYSNINRDARDARKDENSTAAITERLAKLAVVKVENSNDNASTTYNNSNNMRKSIISIDRFSIDHSKLYAEVLKKRSLMPSNEVTAERLKERNRERDRMKKVLFRGNLNASGNDFTFSNMKNYNNNNNNSSSSRNKKTTYFNDNDHHKSSKSPQHPPQSPSQSIGGMSIGWGNTGLESRSEALSKSNKSHNNNHNNHKKKKLTRIETVKLIQDVINTIQSERSYLEQQQEDLKSRGWNIDDPFHDMSAFC